MSLFKQVLMVVWCAGIIFLGLWMSPEAQAKTVDLNIGFGYLRLFDSPDCFEAYQGSHDFDGFSFSLYGGYRPVEWFSIGFGQNLGGFVQIKDNITKYKDFVWYLGSSMVESRFILTHHEFEAFIKFGVGSIYMLGLDHGKVWGGLVFGGGLNYMISESVGIGVSFDYMMGLTHMMTDEHYDWNAHDAVDDFYIEHFLHAFANVVFKF